MDTCNSPRHAVALAYHAGDPAPRVVAKGSGLIAEQIIERAREHGVFMHESRELAALLMQLDLDREIPPALYRAVAEILAWIYRLESGLNTVPAVTAPHLLPQQEGKGAAPCPESAGRISEPPPAPDFRG